MSNGPASADFFAFTSGSSAADFSGVRNELGSRLQIVDIWDCIKSITVEVRGDQFTCDSSLLPFSELSAARCIFYHPDGWELLTFAPHAGDSSFAFARRQLLCVVGFFEHWLETFSAVANRPSNSRLFSNKLIQLGALSQVCPGSLIDTKVLSSSTQLVVGNVIKHVSESRVINKNLSTFAQIVNEDKLKTLSGHGWLPIISQPFIRAKVEYRAYYFGEHSLTVQFARDTEGRCADVHITPDALINAREGEPIQNCNSLFMNVLSALGLRYAAIDFFVVNEEIKILEINPLPSWAWLPLNLKTKVDCLAARFAIDQSKSF